MCMELYYRINIYFLIFIVLYYTVRVYLINILEKNVKLLPWHVLICVYVGILCNFFCAFINKCQPKMISPRTSLRVTSSSSLNSTYMGPKVAADPAASFKPTFEAIVF